MTGATSADSPQLTEQEPAQSFLYDGFISYDHDDRAVAQGIQRGLHRIGRRLGQLHALRVFRDSTDLTASPDLWGKVTEAMDRSRYLIVVLSPNAAASVWVQKEVAYWLERRGAEQLMLVVGGGRLTWDADAARFDPQGSDAALPVLTQPGVLRSEPLYVDVSDDAPWDPAAPLFREKVTDLAAPIHGRPKYELASDDLREQRRFRRLRRAVIVGLAVLSVCAVTAAGIAFVQRQEAVRQRNQAEANLRVATAQKLTAQGQAILVGGQPGSELEVINKIIAAQRISPNVDLGALLTTLVVEQRLRKVVDISGDLSSDGSRLAAEPESGVQILDPETGEAIGKPFADPKTSRIGGLGRDGRYVAMVGRDNVIRIWDSATGLPFGRPLTGVEEYISRDVAVAVDGHRVAAIDGESTVRLWDTETGRPIGALAVGHDRAVNDLAFSPDGRRLATGSWDGTVRLWDADSGAALGEMPRGDQEPVRDDPVNSVEFSPDGHTIAAGGIGVSPSGGLRVTDGSELRLWNADTGAPIGTPEPGVYGLVSVEFSHDGARVVTGGGRTMQVWDARNGAPIGDPIAIQEQASGVAFTAHGDGVISVSGGATQVWAADPDAGLFRELGGSKAAGLGDGDEDYALRDTPAGRRIIVFRDNTLRWLNPDTGQQLGPVVVSDALRGITAFGAGLGHFDISPDGRWLAIAGPDNDINVLEVSSGRLHSAPLRGHAGAVNSVAFSPDGNTLASVSEDKTVRLWDWQGAREIGKPMTGHEYGPDSVIFSSDGRRLYSGSIDSVRIWDTTTRQELGEPTRGGEPMAISPDGRRIAADSYIEIAQFDSESGSEVASAMSPHSAEVVRFLAYSSDGRYMASVSMDPALRIWDTATGHQVGPLIRVSAQGFPHDVQFSPDDRHIYYTATGGIWESPGPTAWPDVLCDKLTANPSAKQWSDWISPAVGYLTLCDGKPVAP